MGCFSSAPIHNVMAKVPGLHLSAKAEVYDGRSPSYIDKRYQYATSTLNAMGQLNRNEPGLIIYPKSLKDVQAVVKYAKSVQKKIAIRTVRCGIESSIANTWYFARADTAIMVHPLRMLLTYRLTWVLHSLKKNITRIKMNFDAESVQLYLASSEFS